MIPEVLLNVGYGVLTFLLGLLILKRIQRLIERLLRRSMPQDMANSTSRLLYYALIFVLILISLEVAGFRVESLLVAGGIVGVAIGFASQKTVSNLISGLFLYIDRPMDIGDSVEIEGYSGVVEDVKPLSTRIRTWEGPVVRIPNEKVFGASIKNFKKVVARRFEYKIGISYTSDVEKAIEVVKEVLLSEPFVLESPAPQVFVSNFLDSAIELTIKAWTPAPKNYSTKTQVLKKIYEAFKKEGIEIPYPQLDLHVKELPKDS